MSAQDRRAFEQWYGAHPDHAVAFHKANMAWKTASRSRVRLDEGQPADAPTPVDMREELNEGDERAGGSSVSRRFAVGGLLAASVAGIVSYWGLRDPAPILYETAPGEQRSLTLADGSQIRLNGGTAFRVAFHRNARDAELLRGEVLLSVAKDASRPFTIASPSGSVRVLGTQFNLRAREDSTELSVIEGRVAVHSRMGEKAEVTAGFGATFSPSFVQLARLDSMTLNQRTAWTQGFVEMTGMPLRQAVAEFNRYRAKPILIADPALETLKMSGRFGIKESDDFLGSLELAFGVAARRNPDGTVSLSRTADQ